MGTAAHEFPGIVPINTLLFDRSERAAIAITAMSAYTNGFEFSVTRLIKAGAPGWDQDPEPGVPGEPFAAHQSFEVSLQFSDGRTVIGKRPHPRPGWELLAGQVNQRRYEALRAYCMRVLREAADDGYTGTRWHRWRDLRRKLTIFARWRAAQERRERTPPRRVSSCAGGLSVYEISAGYSEGTAGPQRGSDILREEGFGRLIRGRRRGQHSRPPPAVTRGSAAGIIEFAALPPHTPWPGCCGPSRTWSPRPAAWCRGGLPGTGSSRRRLAAVCSR